ncbi:MAG: hypothetical protein SFT92_06575 [Rickettsiales bacterium]|nr:hypothetical protein [Rickettsiales bacterium]
MSESKTITATEASRSFSDLLHRVCYGGESFIIKKGSRLMAKIGPVDEVSTQETAVKAEKAPAPIAEPIRQEPAAATPVEPARPEAIQPQPSAPAPDPDYVKQVAAALNKMLSD